MKRYAIVEVPEEFNRVWIDLSDESGFRTSFEIKDFSNGPVELIQAATKKAGVLLRVPRIGDLVMYMDGTWHRSHMNEEDWDFKERPVIVGSGVL